MHPLTCDHCGQPTGGQIAALEQEKVKAYILCLPCLALVSRQMADATALKVQEQVGRQVVLDLERTFRQVILEAPVGA